MKPTGGPAGKLHTESIKNHQQRGQSEAEKERDRLRTEIEHLKQERERLRRELEAALRATKRQAAPHSRGRPKANPKRPGRKSGGRYGRQACRPLPARVDERIAGPLPDHWPHCRGGGGAESFDTRY